MQLHTALQGGFVRAEQAEQRAARLEVLDDTAQEIEQQLIAARRAAREAQANAEARARVGAAGSSAAPAGQRQQQQHNQLARLEKRLQQAEQRRGAAAAQCAAECADGSVERCRRRREEAERAYKEGLGCAEQLEATVVQWEAAVGRAVRVVYADLAAKTGELRQVEGPPAHSPAVPM